MKWCVHFPEEEILIHRPCLKQACAGNKNAAALLSFLLYQASIYPGARREHNHNVQQEITLCFTQREIVARMNAEMSDRTLRDTAIPLLVALGYLSVDDAEKTTAYTVHVTNVQAGIDHAPTISAVLQKLEVLIEDSETSVLSQKYFRRVAALLQTQKGKSSEQRRKYVPHSTELLPSHRGNTSVSHGHIQSAGEQGVEPSFLEDKKKKKREEREKKEAATPETGQKEQMITPAAATHIPQKNHNDKKQTIHVSPEAEAALRLIEHLRGQRFAEPERQYQAHAAHSLMTLHPPQGIHDVQTAWLHGSDDYWRTHHDPAGMTVTDLLHHNSHGKRRIFAILEHHQRQQTSATTWSPGYRTTTSPPAPDGSYTSPSEQSAGMSEQEAQQLMIEISDVARHYDCELHAERLYAHDGWHIRVKFERFMFILQNPGGWTDKVTVIHSIMRARQKIAAEKRVG
jgi:hypothetical protein